MPFCYSCDVCGDTFDPLVNSIMQELCRVRIDPGCPAYPAAIVYRIGVLLTLYEQGTMTTDSLAKSQADKIRVAYLCHGNKIKSQQSLYEHQFVVTTGIPGITGIMYFVMSAHAIILC